MGVGSEKQSVKQWYDGFTFGQHTDIYNPWSITSFIKSRGKYAAYWTNTSGNGLVNSLVQRGNAEIKQTMEKLLEGRSFEAAIDEQIVFGQLDGNADAVWSLLLATGYLRIISVEEMRDGMDNPVYTLALTIFEFKVMDADDDEGTLEETLANAHRQIDEKKYEAELVSRGFSSEQIRKYGFAFRGKECLIG